MLLIIKADIEPGDLDTIKNHIESKEAAYSLASTDAHIIIEIETNSHLFDTKHVAGFPGVIAVNRLSEPFPLAASKKGAKPHLIKVGNKSIGGDNFTLIAGPCSLESEKQIISIVSELKNADVDIIRAGVFKPRTSPYSFQGLGIEGLKILRRVTSDYGFPVVTELLDTRDLDEVYKYTDVIQIGMRNMRNYSLLKEAGKQDKPVLLKRASDASVNEWILAAEYILNEGNKDVILCERGITNPVSCKKTLLDLNGALEAMSLTNLPVIADPSHGAADNRLVAPLAKAAVAAGLHGIMVEVHIEPLEALSDGFQAIKPDNFKPLAEQLRAIRKILGGE